MLTLRSPALRPSPPPARALDRTPTARPPVGVAVAALALAACGGGAGGAPDPQTTGGAPAPPSETQGPSRSGPPAGGATPSGELQSVEPMPAVDEKLPLVHPKDGDVDLGNGYRMRVTGKVRAARQWKPGDAPLVELLTPPPVSVRATVPLGAVVPVTIRTTPVWMDAKATKTVGEVAAGTELVTSFRAEGKVRSKFVSRCAPAFEFWVLHGDVGPMVVDSKAVKEPKGSQHLVLDDTEFHIAPGVVLFRITPNFARNIWRTQEMPVAGYEPAAFRTDYLFLKGYVKIGRFSDNASLAECDDSEAKQLAAGVGGNLSRVTLVHDVELFSDPKKPRIGVISRGATMYVGKKRVDGFAQAVGAAPNVVAEGLVRWEPARWGG